MMLLTLVAFSPMFAPTTGLALHTSDPTSVAIPGSFGDELGCSGDWQPGCAALELALDTDTNLWFGVFAIPAGDWEYKVALNGSWTENYGAGGIQDGPNIALSVAGTTNVLFVYDHATHVISDSVNVSDLRPPGAPIPEPSAALLFGLGAILVSRNVWRRTRRA
jgi:hypothetical protein